MSRPADPVPNTILMTADTVGGVWTYCMDLSRELCARGARVHLAAMGAPLRAAQAQEARAIPGLTLHAHAYKLEWMDHPWNDVDAAGEWLLELARELNPEIVHLNGYAHGALGWKAPVVVVAHSCVLSWWRAVHGSDAPGEWDEYRARVRRGLAGADAVVAPSKAMMRSLQEHYGVAPELCFVVHNGRDGRQFRGAFKQELILSAGRLWDEAKNVRLLQRVAPRLTWPVYVAGDAQRPGGERPALKNVAVLGNLDTAALGMWMGRASIFVLPARYEPFGLSPVEAALSGCALVLGDIPSLREVWGDAAVWVDPSDEKCLASAIQRLIGDSVLRRRMARAARVRAGRYTPKAMTNGYARLYNSVLRGSVACAS